MLSGGSGAAWKPMDATLRDRLAVPFCPLFLSASPAIDAHRVFCNALAGPPGDEPPTVAVVHIRAARESAGLSKMLVAELTSLALPTLPLILLSPAANLSLDPAAMNGRPVRALPTPFVIDEFVDAVNGLAAMVPVSQGVAKAA